jgi:predicted anti-sigma-YlaC factor YlaD
MRCEECREAVSARLDGEASELDAAAADAHLVGCAECRAFEGSATALHRSLRVRPAEPVPDLTAAILAKVPAPSAGRGRVATAREWPRYALFAVALTQLLLALPALLLGHDPGTSAHVARELGSWDVALGIGLLVAAWQPRRAAGLLPFAAALAAALAVTAAFDVAGGRVPIAGEAHHVLDVAGLAVLWVLARTPTLPPRARARITTA